MYILKHLRNVPLRTYRHSPQKHNRETSQKVGRCIHQFVLFLNFVSDKKGCGRVGRQEDGQRVSARNAVDIRSERRFFGPVVLGVRQRRISGAKPPFDSVDQFAVKRFKAGLPVVDLHFQNDWLGPMRQRNDQLAGRRPGVPDKHGTFGEGRDAPVSRHAI